MTDEQQVAQKPKRKQKAKKDVTPLDIAETFDPASAKDKDFDLDMDAVKFQGKKGQAGSRYKGTDGDANLERIVDPRSD